MALQPLPDIPRAGARDKVTGQARYAADHLPEGLAHGACALATVGRGTIASIDTSAAEAVPGVLLVATHEALSAIPAGGFNMAGGYGHQSVQPVTTPRVNYRGQAIAFVVADTLEAAIEGASLVRATYEEEPFPATIDSELAQPVPQPEAATAWPIPDVALGDADAALASAAAVVDSTYRMAPQYQNPMELISTVASWDGDRVTVHEGTQNVGAVQHGLAMQLGIPAENVDVVSTHVGGGFGQKGGLQSQTVLAAWAARELGRPVKVVVPREQVFHDASFRPASLQRVRLGADAEGRFVGAIYEIDVQTSMHDFFQSEHADGATRYYGIENFRSAARLVPTATQTPGYMRAPFEHTSSFAFESAVDELASALGMDPVAMRILNDTQVDVSTGLPLTSRRVVACLERGAAMFGWDQRSPEPGSMVAENGDLIGMGVAIGMYQTSRAPAAARLRARADGSVEVAVGVHEMGQGVRSALANVLSARLGVPPEAVTAVVGDTRGRVPHHLTAGSWGSATAITAADAAADALLAELAALGTGLPEGATPAEILQAAGRDEVEVEARTVAPGQDASAFGALEQGGVAPAGPVYPEFVSCSYGAHFIEVRVEPTTRRVRVPRVVSVMDCGRVLSPRTARSQVIGGVVWGLGGTIREGGEVDARYGNVLNADIAEYVIPVNADIGTIEVDFIDEPDPLVTPTGLKSLGEVVMVGVGAALTSAIHHATGTRVRSIPVRVEDLL